MSDEIYDWGRVEVDDDLDIVILLWCIVFILLPGAALVYAALR